MGWAGDSQFNGMSQATGRGTKCELQCKSLELCLSFPMLHVVVALPLIHGGAPSNHASAPLWDHLSRAIQGVDLWSLQTAKAEPLL